MLKELEDKKKGFTIIEVVIVLVIGAIIMLMVFLVVPYLQRTQRDSRRANDARRLLSAIEQYTANNNGTAPASSANVVGASSGYITETFKDPSKNVNYTITFTSGAASAPTASNVIIVSKAAKCGTNGAIVAGSGTAVSFFQENGKATCIN